MQSITLDQIRKIIDNHQPQLLRTADPETAKSFANITDRSYYSSKEVSEALRHRITNSFSSGHHQVWLQIKIHLNDLIHEHIIHNVPLQPYFSTLRYLQECMRSDSSEVEIQGSWENALKATIDSMGWDGNAEHYQGEHLYQAEFASAYAMKRLRGIGKSGKVSSKPSDISDIRLQEIFNALERQVQHFGGIELAKRLFAWLSKFYDPMQMRYHYVTPLGLYQSWEPKVPINLLINLAAKYPLGKKPYQRDDADWKRLIQLSQDFACLYGVQPSNMYEGLFNTPTSILAEMRRIALHDALFSPLQLRPTDVIRILRGLIGWFQNENKISTIVAQQLDCALTVLAAIQRLLMGSQGPVAFTSDAICKLCPTVPTEEVNNLLVSIFAHPITGANQNFKSITEVPDQSLPRNSRAGANLMDRPLLTLFKDRFVVLDHSVCAPAMVEAVLAYMRQLELTSDLGYAVEYLLSTELGSRDIDIKTGKYQVDNKTFECDLIIESGASILFIEAKAKALTRASRAAFDISLLKDIADSLVYAIVQSGRHSLKIFRDKSVSLIAPSGETEVIELGDRRLERFAITLHDFGGFQDRIVIDQILQNHISIAYQAVDKKHQSDIDKINKNLDELRKNYLELYTQAGSPANSRMFFDCWFLSVPQFLILLDDVIDAESLHRELSRTRHITYSTKDFYYEWKLAKKRQASVSIG